MVHRIPAALRVLARRRVLLLAVAGASLLLTLVLVVLLAIAAAVASVVPGGAQVVFALAVLLYLPAAAAVLSFLAMGVRAYVTFADTPLPASPGGVVGLVAGFGLFFVGRRLRARRGVLGWLTDPFGAATRMAITRAVPVDHPMMALLQVAGMEPRRAPTRGTGLMALGLILAGGAVCLAAVTLEPGLGAALLGAFLLYATLVAVLAAAVRGALGGAWDRTLMERVAQQTQGSLDGLAGTLGLAPPT